ncbi:B- and T-lymphocyte attenuator isoform X2 [Otolemur garnettii]|uniref:B- and T-lymphocyte attenuator isoform X2 n=1 Tax=Otolemur garnettii TaxID=30611 RepID=UPI0002741C07|nr:B- and T-lymphocyte attenuator isoform X2 [Otolemur garnettii]
MKTLPVMLRIGKLFWALFLSPHLDIWSIHGEESCEVQLYIKRQSLHFVSVGKSFQLECPVKYCNDRPNVTWCKLKGTNCSDFGDRFQHTSWEEKKNISVFILHFEPVLPSDNGSYRCFVNLSSKLITSHSTAINVIGKQKKLSDTARGEINLVDVPQLFKSEQMEEGTGQNSQTLPSETGIYDNDPETWFRMQEESEVYSQPCLEENKQGIVYASLNHSIIGMKPKQARNIQETPTEYASICVRS